jgi:hypothetical protein
LKFLFLFFCLSLSAYSQRYLDSLEFTFSTPLRDLFSTNFDKQLNTYSLGSFFALQKNLNDFTLRVTENYYSTFIKTAQKSIRDEHHFTLNGTYRLNDFLKIGGSAQNTILSDNRRIEINQASISNAVLFTELTPVRNITVNPFGGYVNNRQIGENDFGYTYGFEGLVNNIYLNEMNIFSELKFKNEDISPRKNYTRYLNFLLTNFFSENVINKLRVRLLNGRKDFYYSADPLASAAFGIGNNIQSRNETNYIVENRLLYNNFLSLFTLELTGRGAFRKIERDTRFKLYDTPASYVFDTEIDELRLEADASATYNSNMFDGAFRIFYSERDERHRLKEDQMIPASFYQTRSEIEASKNNFGIRTALSFIGTVKFSKRDRLTFSMLQNKFKFDTPSILNFDDRDEVLSIVRLRYSRMLSPFFEGYISADGTLNHIVYIFAEKSSNNNVNRVIRLSSGGIYRGKSFTSLNNFEVSANYTVYDFEDLLPNSRSFSFRQFSALDSTAYWFTQTFGIGFYGNLKLSEQGDLRWTSFSTKPFRYIAELHAEPKLLFNFLEMQLSVGIRFFELNTFNYIEAVKQISTEYNSIGPLLEVIIFMNNKLYLRTYGWYEFIRNNSARYSQANATLSMNWHF